MFKTISIVPSIYLVFYFSKIFNQKKKRILYIASKHHVFDEKCPTNITSQPETARLIDVENSSTVTNWGAERFYNF